MPLDILVEILRHLDVPDVINAGRVCKSFYQAICHETLWKRLYDSSDEVSRKYILESRRQGHSWRESLIINYQDNMVKKKWRSGEMSNTKSYKDLPEKPMCRMTAIEWGDIFQDELKR